MIDTTIIVDDILLRQLSLETKKIGSRVLVKQTPECSEYVADIIDVIIIPHTEFYRKKYIHFYKLCNYNSVKALKELSRSFPFIPDFELGIAYVLNIEVAEENISTALKTAKELEFFNSSLTEIALEGV